MIASSSSLEQGLAPRAAFPHFVAWADCGGITGSRKLPPRRHGIAIPGWSGSSTRCVGAWLRLRSRIRRTLPSPNLETGCKIAFSSAPRTWTIFTSRRDRKTSSTCTGNFSRVVATPVAGLPLGTRISTNRQPKSHGANAAVGFAPHLLVRRSAVRVGSNR